MLMQDRKQQRRQNSIRLLCSRVYLNPVPSLASRRRTSTEDSFYKWEWIAEQFIQNIPRSILRSRIVTTDLLSWRKLVHIIFQSFSVVLEISLYERFNLTPRRLIQFAPFPTS